MATKGTCKRFPYRSDNGFMTKIWGPALWLNMHLISLNYPCSPTDTDKKRYRRFFYSLGDVLPCKACRESYKEFVKKNPDTKLKMSHMRSRHSLARWVFKLHNAINKKVCKPPRTDFLRTMAFYERFRANCHLDKKGCHTPKVGVKRRALIQFVIARKCKNRRSFTCPTN